MAPKTHEQRRAGQHTKNVQFKDFFVFNYMTKKRREKIVSEWAREIISPGEEDENDGTDIIAQDEGVDESQSVEVFFTENYSN